MLARVQEQALEQALDRALDRALEPVLEQMPKLGAVPHQHHTQAQIPMGLRQAPLRALPQALVRTPQRSPMRQAPRMVPSAPLWALVQTVATLMPLVPPLMLDPHAHGHVHVSPWPVLPPWLMGPPRSALPPWLMAPLQLV